MSVTKMSFSRSELELERGKKKKSGEGRSGRGEGEIAVAQLCRAIKRPGTHVLTFSSGCLFDPRLREL
jgi:hypothetical protein